MSEITSPYYPKRARWYSCFRYPWLEVKRALGLERIWVPRGLSFRSFLLSLLVPGHSFRVFGMKHIATLLQAAFVMEAIVFVVALGYFAGNVAFGLMISTHATSIIYLLGRWAGIERLWLRLAMAVAALVVVSQLAYFPLRGLVESRLIPLRVGGKVMVVKKGAAPKNLQRGDVVVYTISAYSGDHLYLREGYGFDAVLALAGDHVRFTTNAFEVNETAYPRLSGMPMNGELVVPEKHWFIWPRLSMDGHGNIGSVNVAGAMLQTAMVSETQYVGRPFNHWFGRRQLQAPKP